MKPRTFVDVGSFGCGAPEHRSSKCFLGKMMQVS